MHRKIHFDMVHFYLSKEKACENEGTIDVMYFRNILYLSFLFQY
jgi:hypothetical protein